MTISDTDPSSKKFIPRQYCEDYDIEAPPHVEAFDSFVERAIVSEPHVKDGFAKFLPQVNISFGEITKNNRYYIGVTLKNKTDISKSLAWHEWPHAGHNFVFSIEDDGSLVRIIEISSREDLARVREGYVAANLGVQAGQEFTDFITAEYGQDINELVGFCNVDDETLNSIVEIHHKIANDFQKNKS